MSVVLPGLTVGQEIELAWYVDRYRHSVPGRITSIRNGKVEVAARIEVEETEGLGGKTAPGLLRLRRTQARSTASRPRRGSR